MNSTFKHIISLAKQKERKLFFFALACCAMFFLVAALISPINVDEVLHYNHAKNVLEWYATLGVDSTCLNTPTSNLTYYGQSVDNLTALINRIFIIENEYLTRHLVGALGAFFLVLVIALTIVEISGSYWAAIAGMLLLLISPRPMGQAVNNLKDIPFALGYAWSILIMIRIFKVFPKLSWKHAILLGLSIAFTNSIRMGGIVLLPYLGLFFLMAMVIHPEYLKSKQVWLNWISRGLLVLVIAYFVSLAFWPFGLTDPLNHPTEALNVMSHYKISIRQIYHGWLHWSTELPWHYLPKWLAISIPELVIFGVLLYIGFLFRRNENKLSNLLLHFILIFAFLFPIIYVIAIKSNLYSGWRQVYFVYAPLVVISSLGFFQLFTVNFSKRIKSMLLSMCGILLVLNSINIVPTLKSDYVYFNKTWGGNQKAWGTYEYDYYWHHLKWAVNWLNEKAAQEGNLKVACNFDLNVYQNLDGRINVEYVHFYERSKVDYDYAILETNYIHPNQMRDETWKPATVIAEKTHHGNTQIVVLSKNSIEAKNAYQAYNNANWVLAESNFEEALKIDPSDVNMMAYLGNCYLKNNELEKLNSLINKGTDLHNFYEPFLFLKARMLYSQQKYKQCSSALFWLFRKNPRYTKALPLLMECYEKLGEYEKAEKLRKKYNIETNETFKNY